MISADARLTCYAATLAALAVSLVPALTVLGYGLGTGWVIAILAVVSIAAERGSIRFNSRIEQSISVVPSLFAAILFGPLAAMAVAASSMAADFGRPYTKWAIYTSSRTVTAALTGVIAVLVDSRVEGIAGIALATATGALVAQTNDVLLGSVVFYLRGYGRIWEPLKTMAPALFAAIPIYAPVVAALGHAYRELSPWTLPLFLVPALAAQRSFVLYKEQQRLAGDLVTANAQLERANLSFASALVATLDARDRYTAGHSAAVAVYARDIAQRMGLPPHEQQLAHLCGLVHDIGKIGLPPGLLDKPGPLTLDERRQMQEHSEIGERILANVDDYTEIAKIVRHHHERMDGEGYPDRLRAEEIPLISRIIAVADAYNAMTSDRPYRDAMPSRVARLRLAQAVESQFDTSVVAAFEAILARSSDDYRLGSRRDFTSHGEDERRPIAVAALA